MNQISIIGYIDENPCIIPTIYGLVLSFPFSEYSFQRMQNKIDRFDMVCTLVFDRYPLHVNLHKGSCIWLQGRATARAFQIQENQVRPEMYIRIAHFEVVDQPIRSSLFGEDNLPIGNERLARSVEEVSEFYTFINEYGLPSASNALIRKLMPFQCKVTEYWEIATKDGFTCSFRSDKNKDGKFVFVESECSQLRKNTRN